MTLAEVERAVEAKQKKRKLEAQERAAYDYILAELIGRSIGRLYSSANKYPEISEVYPALFNDKEIAETKQQKINELSALRFKHFAQSYNKRFNKEAAKE